ncbi:hypothetical protein D3C78_1426640 [compost metagenome]
MPPQVVDELDAIAIVAVAGHVVVGDHDVRLGLRAQPHQLAGIARLADHDEARIALDHFAHPRQHDGVVVRQYNSDCFHKLFIAPNDCDQRELLGKTHQPSVQD